MALVGGVVAALIAAPSLAGSIVGLLVLFAIAVRNGVVLISHLQGLERERGRVPRAPLVPRGARERFGPILTTRWRSRSCAAVRVMGAAPGLEVVQPMAVVLLGGLFTSTFLALFVLPALTCASGGRRAADDVARGGVAASLDRARAGDGRRAAAAPRGRRGRAPASPADAALRGEARREPPRRRRAGPRRLAPRRAGAGACTEVESATAAGYEPAQARGGQGPGDVKRVTFTAEGARRMGLQTAAVDRATGARSSPTRR